jgi:pantetheine-phosphate adenylyltransferase
MRAEERELTIAIYPGRFDPVTNGHLDIVHRAARIFGSVIVGVAQSRSTMFTTEERVELFQKAVEGWENVTVDTISGLTVEFARQRGASVLVRGIRAVTDFETEFDMALMNKKMVPEIESVYLMTSLDYLYVSASRIREVTSLGRDPAEFVPPHVSEALKRKFESR